MPESDLMEWMSAPGFVRNGSLNDFAMGQIRQIRARWAEMKGFFNSRLPEAATEVLNIFVKAYNLAKSEKMKTVLKP